MANKRIIDLTEKATLESGDFMAVDSATGGTKKYQLGNATSSKAGLMSSADKSALDTAVTDIADLKNDINRKIGAYPQAVSTVAEMTDENAIYLYTGTETGYNAGHFYYFENGDLIDGGVYGQVDNGTVTPQMYGAKADGVTDDTTAIQNALNSGRNVFSLKALM